MTLRIGSLFSGYGGLDLALHTLFPDSQAVWVSDIEPGPTRVLAHRFPHAVNLGDITTIDWNTVEPVDVLCGGSPCQDLSSAGSRAGMRPGTRSGLWESMTHAIHSLKPRLVVWENVLGALSADAYSLCDLEPRQGCVGGSGRAGSPVLRALGRVLGDLANQGYDARWIRLRAGSPNTADPDHVGAPHQRARIFLIAWPTGKPFPVTPTAATINPGLMVPTVSLLPTPVARDHKDTYIGLNPKRPDDLDTLARALTLLPTPVASISNDRETPGTWQARQERMTEKQGRGFSMPLTIAVQLLPTPNTMEHLPARDGEALERARYRGNLDGSRRTRSANLRERVIEDQTNFGIYTPAIRRWEAVTGIPAPAPTTPHPTSGKPQLSQAFTEWMMGLPQGWITDPELELTRTQSLRLAGNGVVPQQAAKAIHDLLQGVLA